MFFKPKRIKKLEEKIEELENQIVDKDKDIAHYLAESINYKNQLDVEKRTSEMLLEKVNKTEQESKEWEHKFASCLKVGIEKDEKIAELEDKVKELSSNAYLRVPLKPQRIPKAEPVKIKSSAKLSNIARKHRIEVEK